MKKVIIFSSVLIALFIGIWVITANQQKEEMANNPYQKEDLHPETIAQLDDPNYQNLILPDELSEKIKNEETFTIYFYQSTCPHCKVTSPIVVPMAEEMGIDLKLYNLLEFEDGWNQYHIEATPTIVHFEKGKEVDRIVGAKEPEVFQEWFEKNAD